MHIQDEHLAKGLVKTQLKHDSQAKSTSSSAPSASYKETVNILESTINSNPPKCSLCQICTDIIFTAIFEKSAQFQNSSWQPPQSPDSPQFPSEFSNIISYQLQLLEADNNIKELPQTNLNQTPTSNKAPASNADHTWTKLKLSELFDISSSLWSTRYGNFASFTYKEELELYDLIDLDSDGELDLEVVSGIADMLKS